MLAETRLYVPSIGGAALSPDVSVVVREALVARHKLRFTYANEQGDGTERTVRPLGMFFWGRVWTLAAWCELRNDFRNFRLDRISAPARTDTFDDEPGRTLKDLLTRYGPEVVKLLDQ